MAKTSGDWPGRHFCRAVTLLYALFALLPAMTTLVLLSLGAALVGLVTRRPAAEPWYPVMVWMRQVDAVLRLGAWLEARLGPSRSRTSAG